MTSFRTIAACILCASAHAADGNSMVGQVDSGRVPTRGAPAPRPRAIVDAALAATPPLTAAERSAPLRVLLIAGRKDHGRNEHDYPAWRAAMARLLGYDAQVAVQGGDDLPAAEAFAQADVAVLFRMGAWSAQLDPAVAAFQERGGGLVLLHSAVATSADTCAAVTGRIGLSWSPGKPAHVAGKACCGFRQGTFRLSIADTDHPLLAGLRGVEVELRDETYMRLHGDLGRVTLLAQGSDPDGPTPMLWAREQGRGRVVVDLLGHYNWIHNDPLQRLLLLRAIAWAAHRPVDRLRDLVLRDADVGEP